MLFKPFLRESFMPLPVAFISTVSAAGIRNIAPYGCIMPILRPLDLICLASAYRRDTLVNIRATRQFVVNLVGVNFADKVIPTARFSPPEEDEFILAGLEEKPSEMIKAPGIAGSYAWMECELFKTHEESNYVLIVAKVLRLEVEDHVLDADGGLDIRKARPLMMSGNKKGMHFATLTAVDHFEPFGAMFPDGKDLLGNRYSD
jgi:flavin reductase (DIM6/NTAB) family NADH-FMN oxidoreductase RutF